MSAQRNMQYAQIKTLAELRAAKERLKWEVEVSEKNMVREVTDIKSKFTLGYALSFAFGKFGVSSSTLGVAMEGFKLARMVYKNFKERRADKGDV